VSAGIIEQSLHRLTAVGRISSGEFTPGGAGTEWCDGEVLRLLRRRSLAALRHDIEPVPATTLARFLPAWQHVGSASRGVEAVVAAIEQLQGVAIPASAWERLVLPARVADYSPAYLDEVCASGEVVWAGAGASSGGDGWVMLAFADEAPLLLPEPAPALVLTPCHEAMLTALEDGRALFFRTLAQEVHAQPSSDEVEPPNDADLVAALWDLVWAGWVSGDTWAPLRGRLSGTGAHRARPTPGRARYRRPRRPEPSSRSGPWSAMGGRWYRLPPRESDPTRRATALTDALLERHGVLTRTAIAAEGIPGGFAGLYPVLSAQEERGAVRRGYFVEGLGAAQFAAPGAVDRLRSWAADSDDGPGTRGSGSRAVVLAATDPANPYGGALPWPQRVVDTGGGAASGHRAGRKAGALVVLVDGGLALYVERGGRTLLSYVDDGEALATAAKALADAVHGGALGALLVERADGTPVHATPLREALATAGFRVTPRGLRLRG
jgi:ATP-dependent Lhr-like helicase